jgi:putative flippase GtrA
VGDRSTPGFGERALQRPAAHQFARFLVVGVGNTAVSFVSYRLLLALGVPYAAAAPLSFGVGALNGYIFNRSWTFAARDSTRARVLYVGIQAAGAGSLSLLVVAIVHVADVGEVPAYLVAIPPVTVSMFVANRFWTFRDRDGGDGERGGRQTMSG